VDAVAFMVVIAVRRVLIIACPDVGGVDVYMYYFFFLDSEAAVQEDRGSREDSGDSDWDLKLYCHLISCMVILSGMIFL
jgi:hypothetical protein